MLQQRTERLNIKTASTSIICDVIQQQTNGVRVKLLTCQSDDGSNSTQRQIFPVQFDTTTKTTTKEYIANKKR